jgi:hypothetical protein
LRDHLITNILHARAELEIIHKIEGLAKDNL